MVEKEHLFEMRTIKVCNSLQSRTLRTLDSGEFAEGQRKPRSGLNSILRIQVTDFFALKMKSRDTFFYPDVQNLWYQLL